LRPIQYGLCSSQFVISRASDAIFGSSKGNFDTNGAVGGRMGSTAVPQRMQKLQLNRGAMRVVVLEPDADYRDGLHCGFDQLTGFQLVGESVTWDECLTLLETHLPELLITGTGCVPSASREFAGEAEFPVVMGLRAKDGGFLAGAFETLDLPIDPKSLRVAMERIRTEIYRRKLDEISNLLGRYMDYSRGLHRFLTAVRVEDGGSAEIPAENVVFMAADGNYVRLHTGADVHEIRDTMSGMTSKLDPAQFARVHRSFIVNRAHVTSVLRREGAAMALLLSNGTEIPVGPNYRAEVESFASYDRLST
jgi:LytTr DNA-binding domain-containing protein